MFIAVYDIGGSNVAFFTTSGQGRGTYSVPGHITSPAALGPEVFAFNTPNCTYCIDPVCGRTWTI